MEIDAISFAENDVLTIAQASLSSNDHLARDIGGVDLPKNLRQRACHPSNATADFQQPQVMRIAPVG